MNSVFVAGFVMGNVSLGLLENFKKIKLCGITTIRDFFYGEEVKQFSAF